MSVRLIVADLDGTLLNSDHVVAPFTEAALHEARSLGVLFTVATGKTFPSTRNLIQQFNIEIPLICGNGTSVYAPDGTVLHRDPIPREYAIEAVRMAREAGLTPVVYAGANLLAPVWDDSVEVLVAHHEPMPVIVPDLEGVLHRDYTPDKLVFMRQGDLDAVAEFQTALEHTFYGKAQVLRSGLPFLVELLPFGITKGTALDFILKYLDIMPEETICFGDNCNDLDMIQRAGIGVAMGHSPEAVREGADYVTATNDDDGVGYAIHRFVLTPRPFEA